MRIQLCGLFGFFNSSGDKFILEANGLEVCRAKREAWTALEKAGISADSAVEVTASSIADDIKNILLYAVVITETNKETMEQITIVIDHLIASGFDVEVPPPTKFYFYPKTK